MIPFTSTRVAFSTPALMLALTAALQAAPPGVPLGRPIGGFGWAPGIGYGNSGGVWVQRQPGLGLAVGVNVPGVNLQILRPNFGVGSPYNAVRPGASYIPQLPQQRWLNAQPDAREPYAQGRSLSPLRQNPYQSNYSPPGSNAAGGDGPGQADPSDLTTLPPNTPATAPRIPSTARFVIYLPAAETKLWVDDTLTTQTGDTREFTTPAILTPGKVYTYKITIQWTSNGQIQTRERTIDFEAGNEVIVDLRDR